MYRSHFSPLFSFSVRFHISKWTCTCARSANSIATRICGHLTVDARLLWSTFPENRTNECASATLVMLTRKKILALFTSTSRSCFSLFSSSFVFFLDFSSFLFLPFSSLFSLPHFVSYQQFHSFLVSTLFHSLLLTWLYFETSSGASLFAAWFRVFYRGI